MYAYVRTPDERFYRSMVFGYGRFEDTSKNYWIVLNEKKTKLVKISTENSDYYYLNLLVIIVDCDRSGWTPELTNGIDCVSYFPFDRISKMIDDDTVPDELLERCIAEDRAYQFCEYPEIRTQRDIDNLYWASGWFHDGYIAEEKMQDDGTLYLRFEGTWGCQVELWLWGDLRYDTSFRHLDADNAYWFKATILLHNGLVYFSDDMDLTAEQIDEEIGCWFKARHMKYHIIPETEKECIRCRKAHLKIMKKLHPEDFKKR